MALRRAPELEEPDNMNMTPMIDVTFQLIIFFMLVTDMTQQQLERLTLPVASQALREKFADDSILVVNIRKDGVALIQRKVVFRPPAQPGQRVDAKLLEDIFRARQQMKKYQEIEGKDDYVKYPLLIRADRSAHWEWVQLIMMIAANPQIGGVTRVQLGANLGQEGQ